MIVADLLIRALAAAGGLIFAAALGQFVHSAYKTVTNYSEFRRKLKGIPFLTKGHRFYDGHFNRFGCTPRNWLNHLKDHEKHGKSYAFMYGSQPAIATTDLNIIKKVSIDEADIHTERNAYGIIPVDEFIMDNIIMSGGEQWRKLRRCIAPALSNHKLKLEVVQDEMNKSVDKFIDSIGMRIKGQDFAVIDTEDIFHRWVLDLVFRCFYKQENQVDFHAKHDYWQHMTEKTCQSIVLPVMELPFVFPLARHLIQFLMLYFHVTGETRLKMMDFIKRQTRMNLEARQKLRVSNSERKEDEVITLDDGQKYRRNLMDPIIDKFHDGHLTTREYLHSSFSLFFAANKTLADGLSKLIYLLAKNLDKQEKLRGSISVEGTDSEYLTWCIHESLRLFPPAHIGASRMTDRDVRIGDGTFIPSGTVVFTSTYTIHRSKEYWGEDADDFRPERWVNAKNFHPAQYLAFGAGARRCLGKDFAMQALKLATVKLLRDYRLEYVSGTNDDMLFSAPFLIFCVYDGPTNIKITRV